MAQKITNDMFGSRNCRSTEKDLERTLSERTDMKEVLNCAK